MYSDTDRGVVELLLLLLVFVLRDNDDEDDDDDEDDGNVGAFVVFLRFVVSLSL